MGGEIGAKRGMDLEAGREWWSQESHGQGEQIVRVAWGVFYTLSKSSQTYIITIPNSQ